MIWAIQGLKGTHPKIVSWGQNYKLLKRKKIRKVIIVLFSILLGYVGGLYTNYSLMEDNFTLRLAAIAANNRAEKAEKAAGQLSDVIRDYKAFHIGEPNSIDDFLSSFADSATVEQYLSEYSYSY